MKEKNTFLLELRCAFCPPGLTHKQQTNRYNTFFSGIKKFLSLHKKMLELYNVDVYLLDNTISSIECLPNNIYELLKNNNIKTVFTNKNDLGYTNKGVGEIEGLIYMSNEIKKYDWFIHFEPRQQILSTNFLKSFFSNPRILFTYNNSLTAPRHFNTGLYVTKSKYIIAFIKQFNKNRINEMITKSESLEYTLHNFYNETKIPYNVLEKMDLIWIDAENTLYHY